MSTCNWLDLQTVGSQPIMPQNNVRGELVFNIMAADWFCEKSGWIGKVEDVKPVLLKEENGFQPATILRRRIFTRMNCEISGFHPVWFI